MTEKSELPDPVASLDEGLFVLSFWILVWGPLFAVFLLKENFVLLLVTPLILITTLRKGKIRRIILKHRPVIVFFAAFFAGYCWYAYLEQHSESFQTRAAALEACIKLKTCVEAVRHAGFEIDPSN